MIHEIMCLKEYSSLPGPGSAAAAVAQHLPLTQENSSFLPYLFFVLLVNFIIDILLVKFLFLTMLLLKGKSCRSAGMPVKYLLEKGRRFR